MIFRSRGVFRLGKHPGLPNPRGISLVLLVCASFLTAPSIAEVNLQAYPDGGYPAPAFNLPDLQGRSHNLSDYRGKVVLLNVWATWCYPCRMEMPAMEALHQKLKDENFVVLAVSIDQSGPDNVRRYVEKNRLTFQILLSPDGVFQRRFIIQSIPTTFIIDKNGRIVSRVPGAREWNSPETFQAMEKLIHR